MLTEREYDGNAGGLDVGPYVIAYVEHRDQHGHRFRTRGGCVVRSEARRFALAMLSWIDRLESTERMGCDV